MKKVFKLLLFSLILFIFTYKVNAEEYLIYVGGEEISTDDGEVSIGGGTAKLEEVSSGNFMLTLKNVNLTNMRTTLANGWSILFFSGNLTIKLVGNNTINPTFNDAVSNYYVISTENPMTLDIKELNIIGDGTLNINASGYENMYGMNASFVNIGSDEYKPTINVDLESDVSGSLVFFVNTDFNVINSTIKGKIKGELAAGFYTSSYVPSSVKKSDINLDLYSSDQAIGIFSYYDELLIEDTDMLIKSHNLGDCNENVLSSHDLLTIKDSRIVLLLDDTTQDKYSLYNVDSNEDVKFIHTSGKKFLFLTNAPIHTHQIIKSNVTNDMIYTSSVSLDDLENVDNLSTASNIVITTGVTNKIVSGNNQSFVKNKINSYKITTNHFRYLVKNIKVDDTTLDEEDYNLTKDSKVVFTTSGINKIKTLGLGNHTVNINYYYGNSLSYKFKITESIVNPQTGDNIINYILILLGSVITLISCLFIKKVSIN